MVPVIQDGVVDVTNWLEDPEYFNYPEGAREKSALFPPEPVPFDFIKPERRYLFKLSDPRYPEQFWAEVIAYVAGCLLGVEVPPAYIAIHQGRQVSGALIEWFFVDGEQVFVAGGNRLQRLVPEYDRKKGTDHSFQLVQRACLAEVKSGLQGDWLLYWAQAFLFDALIGNTDRHQDNWGFLSWTDDAGNAVERLAPLFDNGTSLGMERHLDHVRGWDDNRCEAYLGKGCHHMKWQNNDIGRCRHFDLVAHVVNGNPRLRPVLKEALENFSLQEFERKVRELCKLTVLVPLTNERVSFTLKLVTLRHRRLCTILS